MNTTPSAELLTSQQACDALGGIDRSTLVRWVQTDKIRPAMKLPGRRGAYLFQRSEIDRVNNEAEASDA